MARSITSGALVVALAPAWVKLLDVVTKVKSPVLAATTKLALKAVKCPASSLCPSVASSHHLLQYNAEITLTALETLGLQREVDHWRSNKRN
jgi:hypothetical protein